MSSRSEDKLLDEMFEPFITFFNDEDDFIVKFNELYSFMGRSPNPFFYPFHIAFFSLFFTLLGS